ncbi:MAG: glycine/D-amino acid oxidase-like deaminating enzyme [Gammaproteobacteria bacterium]
MIEADAVICGAGIAGIAAAHALVRDAHLSRVIIVEQGAPLSLTSDKSTECYRNWWPGPDNAMTALSCRSISLMEALASNTGNAIVMDRRGYLYLSEDVDSAESFAQQARSAESLGAGALRIHESAATNYANASGMRHDASLHGADLLLGSAHIQQRFPWLNPGTRAALHVRRAGALSAQQLGMVLLQQAREGGAQIMSGTLTQIDCDGSGAVSGVRVDDGQQVHVIRTRCVIDAAGPYVTDVAKLVNVSLPVYCERHVKLSFNDIESVLPRDAPLSIWCDPTPLPWNEDERDALLADVDDSPAGSSDSAALLAPYPAGVHGRPIGAGQSVILYWTYDCPIETPHFPVIWDASYPEIVLRGMSVMIPGLSAYYERMPNAFVDGGYYTKTAENRPLIGPTTVEGFYLCGAFSGFGIMMAMGAGELVAAQAQGQPLPDYAHHFELSRYDDPTYRDTMADVGAAGQL